MVKNTTKKSECNPKVMPRTELTELLFKYDTEYLKELNKDEKIKIKFENISLALDILEDELELSKYRLNLDTYRNEKCFFISDRQYNCFMYMIEHIHNGKLANAYHELCDFIHNYRDVNQISVNEKIYISMAVKLIRKRLEVVFK